MNDREFTLFPALPIELRLKIWAYCYTLQGPRIVEVRSLTLPPSIQNRRSSTRSRKRQRKIKVKDQGRLQYQPRYSPTHSPIIANVNYESHAVAREEALKAGHLFFDKSIFFNPEIDLLYLLTEPFPTPGIRGPNGTWMEFKRERCEGSRCSDGVECSGCSDLASKLRFLALDLEKYGNQFDPMRLATSDFPNLEELLFVLSATSTSGPKRIGVPDWVREYKNPISKLKGAIEENSRLLIGMWARRWMQSGMEWQANRIWPRVRLVGITKTGFVVLGEKGEEDPRWDFIKREG